MIELTDEQAVALTDHRAESWRYDVLNLQDQKIGELDGATGGSFDLSVSAAIRGTGSLTVVAAGIDWLKVRIQPWYTATAKGEVITWPLGVFLPASPGTDYAITGGTQSLELYDKLLILDQDHTDGTFAVAAGTNVTAQVRTMLQTIGEVRDAITDSTATVKNSMVWDPDTSKLKIINDLLASINYFSLFADGYGTFHAAPYVAPSGRGRAWSFEDGDTCIYKPGFTLDEDTFSVPNKVIQVSTSDGDTPAMVSTVTNEDPNSPYSYNQRGRWITVVESGVEATSQPVLDAIAQRRLAELSGVSATYPIEHLFIPLDLNDSVQFIRSTEGIKTAAVIQNISISTEVGAMAKTTLLGVQV